MKLTEISDSYKETAHSFFESSKLLSVLEKYGKIEFEGAYAGNVMLHGDVDIKVIRDTDYTQDEMFTILRDIHDTCSDNIRSLFIKADWDDPRFGQQYPYGKYIGLKTSLNDERWKFDIWFISDEENERDRGKLDISKADLGEEQRLKILEFKQYRKEHNLKVSGQEIYEAVLEDKQIKPDSFFSKRSPN
jgi:hypothetical protein